jgi:hypothetical protein
MSISNDETLTWVSRKTYFLVRTWVSNGARFGLATVATDVEDWTCSLGDGRGKGGACEGCGNECGSELHLDSVLFGFEVFELNLLKEEMLLLVLILFFRSRHVDAFKSLEHDSMHKSHLGFLTTTVR